MQHYETGIICVTAPNASPLTYRGTNTFVVGTRRVVVIDPGPIDDAHKAQIVQAVDGRPVDAVFVTHSHLDHSPMAKPLAAEFGAPVIAYGDSQSGRSPIMQQLGEDIGGGEGVDPSFHPDQTVGHLDLCLGFTILHTPGHMGNHICLEKGDVLFCGDHIMGWSTSLVSPPDGDLTNFMQSCEMLLSRPARRYFPAHGDPIDRPHERVQEIIDHRRSREAQILEALSDRAQTADELVQILYSDINRHLWPAAKRNIIAHLIDLTSQNCVEPIGKLDINAAFQIR